MNRSHSCPEPIPLISHSLAVPRTWPIISLFYPMSSSKVVGFSSFCSSSLHSTCESRVTKQQNVPACSRWVISPSAISLQKPRICNRVLVTDSCPLYPLSQKASSTGVPTSSSDSPHKGKFQFGILTFIPQILLRFFSCVFILTRLLNVSIDYAHTR